MTRQHAKKLRLASEKLLRDYLWQEQGHRSRLWYLPVCTAARCYCSMCTWELLHKIKCDDFAMLRNVSKETPEWRKLRIPMLKEDIERLKEIEGGQE